MARGRVGGKMAKTRCPNCGVLHEIDEKKGTFENRVRRPFKTDAMAAPLPQPGIIRETPVNLPTLPSHVYVPLLQSLIDGFYVFPGGVVGGIVIVAVVDGATKIEITGWGFALAGLAGGVMASFFWAGQKWNIHLKFVNSLLWVAEEIFQTDFDGDEEIGQPQPPMVNQVQVEVTEKGIPRQIEGLNIAPDKLTRLAQLYFDEGKSFSERTAAEAGMSRDEEWMPLRDKFIGREWAAWRRLGSPTQGISLLSRGEAVLRAFLPPTLLSGGMGQNNVLGTHPPAPTQSNYERFDHIQGVK